MDDLLKVILEHPLNACLWICGEGVEEEIEIVGDTASTNRCTAAEMPTFFSLFFVRSQPLQL